MQSVCWFGLINQNHMFGADNFGDKSPLWFLKILKLFLFYSDNFKIFRNALVQFFPNRPSKYVISSTN